MLLGNSLFKLHVFLEKRHPKEESDASDSKLFQIVINTTPPMIEGRFDCETVSSKKRTICLL